MKKTTATTPRGAVATKETSEALWGIVCKYRLDSVLPPIRTALLDAARATKELLAAVPPSHGGSDAPHRVAAFLADALASQSVPAAQFAPAVPRIAEWVVLGLSSTAVNSSLVVALLGALSSLLAAHALQPELLAQVLAALVPFIRQVDEFSVCSAAASCVRVASASAAGALPVPVQPVLLDALVDSAVAMCSRVKEDLSVSGILPEFLAALSAAVSHSSKPMAQKRASQIVPQLAALVCHGCGGHLPSDGATRQRGDAIRRQSLAALCSYAAVSPQLLFQHWPSLFPLQQGVAGATEQSVLGILRSDPSVSVRVAAAEFVIATVLSSKPYMVAVTAVQPLEQAAKPKAFTPFTHTLGATLLRVHAAVTAALESEQNPLCLQHILRCMSTLASSAPYDKLGESLLASAFDSAAKLFASRDASVRAAALECAGSIFGAQPQSPALSRHLADNNQQCVRSVMKALSYRDSPEVHSQALRAIGNAARNYPASVPWSSGALQAIDSASRSEDASVRLGAVTAICQAASSPSPSRAELWGFILPAFVSRVSADSSPLVRAAAIEVISNVTTDEGVASTLSPQKLEFAMEKSLSATRDQSAPVRCAAFSALGACVSCFRCHEGQEQRPRWLNDVVAAAASASSRDQAVSVRAKAAWALANAASHVRGGGGAHDATPESVAESLLRCCSDVEKVRANAVRGLGNIASAAPFLLRGPSPGFAERISAQLVSAIKTSDQAKTQWNACKALVHVLQEPSLAGTELSAKAFDALVGLLGSTKFFKNRIHSAQTLSSLASRELYGSGSEPFCTVLSALLDALGRTGDATDDFAAFKYRETLSDTLVGAVARLSVMATESDCAIVGHSIAAKAFIVVQAFRDALRKAAQQQETAAPEELIAGLKSIRVILESDPEFLTEDAIKAMAAIDETLSPL